jgi:glycerol-3-phosphate acyltransferase PlsY
MGLGVLQAERGGLVLPSVALAALIVFLDRANIRRLLNGAERRFGRRAAPGTAG